MIGYLYFFFFNDTATTEIYTLSLHDALPISGYDTADLYTFQFAPQQEHLTDGPSFGRLHLTMMERLRALPGVTADRKSTRLNSSHANISYAVFCLKKKKIVFTNSGRLDITYL